jgi:hypothetical protein
VEDKPQRVGHPDLANSVGLCHARLHFGNGPAIIGPESNGSQACLQWAHCTLR